MAHCIPLLLTLLLRLLLPPRGRHRAVPSPADTPPSPLVITACAEVDVRPQQPHPPLLRGEDSPLVRPYVLTPAERRTHKLHRRQQRHHHRALWLAVHGIDIGPRWIHGVEVTA
jgi:hypothetical protein